MIPLPGAGVNRCGRPPDAGWGTGTYLPDGGELSRYLASYAAFDPEGRVIVTASDDGTARVWSAKTGRSLTVMRGHEGFVTRAAFNPARGIVATVGEDGDVRPWQIDKSRSRPRCGTAARSAPRCSTAPAGWW